MGPYLGSIDDMTALMNYLKDVGAWILELKRDFEIGD